MHERESSARQWGRRRRCDGPRLVADRGRGGRPRPVVAGPFPTRAEAGWAATEHAPGTVETVYGVRRPDGRVKRRPSPQEWAWLAYLGEQLGRLPAEWEDVVDDEDPLTTLVVEVTAALAEAGLPLHDADRGGRALGGAVLALRARPRRHRRHLAPARADERRPGARRRRPTPRSPRS